MLDLFCGPGGAAAGYSLAGLDVVGVDIKPQPRYPFEFYEWDAMTFPLAGFDVVHASPPCQAYSITRHGHTKTYPQLIEPLRARLQAANVPYVIENVVGAPLINPIMVCATAFSLTATDDDGTALFLRRHRLFESNLALVGTDCGCAEQKRRGLHVGGVYGGARRNRKEAREVRHGGYVPSKRVQQRLMGIEWMTESEMYEAIPPAYTEFIGAQLLRAVEAAA